MENNESKKNILIAAIRQSFIKLSPRRQLKNPVIFVVFSGAIMTTTLYGLSFVQIKSEGANDILIITLILWLTVLFANFVEAIAEGRGRAQTDSLRRTRKDVKVRKLNDWSDLALYTEVKLNRLKKGDLVYVKSGELIPLDGNVIEGTALVDESAITGEAAPVLRESREGYRAVSGGSKLLSDWLVIQVTVENSERFWDKMIMLARESARKKTPNAFAVQIFLMTLTIIFLVVGVILLPSSYFFGEQAGTGAAISLTYVIALLVCLAPTTMGALLSPMGIAGMNRLQQVNVLAKSGSAIEAAGNVDVLLLDKTGIITRGNRQASVFIPITGVTEKELAVASQLASLADETAEGRSIVVLAKERFDLRERDMKALGASCVALTEKAPISGINYRGNELRKGAAEAIKAFVLGNGGNYPQECHEIAQKVANDGGIPLVVAKNKRVLGVIYLKDVGENEIKERFEDLRQMGVKTIMITSDNPMTAAAIAAEAGVDDFLAGATPDTKLALIRNYQAQGQQVAVSGNETKDISALIQADVAVAMNTSATAVKEAGNMIDLDSNPTKLIEIVRIGKQLLMTRGALTTFSVANDLAEYFALIPVLFYNIYQPLARLNILGLTSVKNAILVVLSYNVLLIIAMIPLVLKGGKDQGRVTAKWFEKNRLIDGLGGLLTPFVAIKLLNMLLTALGLE